MRDSRTIRSIYADNMPTYARGPPPAIRAEWLWFTMVPLL